MEIINCGPDHWGLMHRAAEAVAGKARKILPGVLTDWVETRLLPKTGIDGFRIAGTSVTVGGPVNDIDLYPVGEGEYSRIKSVYDMLRGMDHDETVIPVHDSANAVTFRLKGCATVFQLCKYHKPTLEALVESFDFAHVKAGAEVRFGNGYPMISAVYVSPDYLRYRIDGQSFYTGSEYPLSSAMRVAKYAARGLFTAHGARAALIAAMADAVGRGFDGYDDFKDQMDAIDMFFQPSDVADPAFRLFHFLNRNPYKAGPPVGKDGDSISEN